MRDYEVQRILTSRLANTFQSSLITLLTLKAPISYQSPAPNILENHLSDVNVFPSWTLNGGPSHTHANNTFLTFLQAGTPLLRGQLFGLMVIPLWKV